MQKLITAGISFVRAGLMWVMLIGMISFSGYAIAQPANADIETPKQARTEIQKDLATENREDLYESEVKVLKNPKVEIEKQYEENVEEYFDNNPEQSSVIEKVKDLVIPDTKRS
jgi:CRISPR/Cas system-associated protein Cas5 (RAMP superfamily)